jgi:hypothetical protein
MKEKEEPKKLDKIIEGKVIQRKKPLGRKFTEIFIGGDARETRSHVLYEVMVPGIKDIVFDIIKTSTEQMLFGQGRAPSTRGRVVQSLGHVAYNRMGQSSSNRYTSRMQQEEPRSISRRARATHDFDEIILEERSDCMDVIEELSNLIDQYQSAKVSDLYELVGITGEFTDEKWGWTTMRDAGCTRVKGGFLLNLPRPEPLD